MRHYHNNNESYLAIDEKLLRGSIEKNEPIEIVMQGTVYIRDPHKWLQGELKPQVFKRPDEPLNLYWNDLRNTMYDEDTKQTMLNL